MESENKTKSGIVLSPNEAEEYCEFKRQKRIGVKRKQIPRP